MYKIYSSMEKTGNISVKKTSSKVVSDEISEPASCSSVSFSDDPGNYFEAIVASLKDAIMVLDPDLNLIYANDSFYKMFKIKPAELLGNDTDTFVDFKKNSPELFDRLSRVCKKGFLLEDFGLTYHFINAGTRSVLINGRQIRYDGSCVALVTFEYIDELKTSEEGITRYEGQYSTLIEKGNEGVIVVLDNEIRYTNKKFCELTGSSKDNIIGSPFLDHISLEYRRMVSKKYNKCLSSKNNDSNIYEANIVSLTEGEIPVEVTASYIEYEGQSAVMLNLNDIREKRKAEKALVDTEKNFRIIFEKSPIGIVRFDRKGIITNSNEVFNEIFDHLRNVIAGYNVLDLFSDKDVRSDISDVISGKIRNYEDDVHLIVNDNNSILHVTFSSLIIDGSLQGGMGIFEDVTLWKMGERSLQLNESRLETLLELNQMSDESIEDILNFTLEAAATLTQSNIGYLVSVREDNSFDMVFLLLTDEKGQYKLSKDLGDYPFDISSRVIKVSSSGKYLLSNYPNDIFEMENDHNITGTITRHFDIPVSNEEGERFVMGVGNKDSPYDDLDTRNLALLIQEMKKLIEHREADEALRVSEEKYSNLVKNGNDGIIIIRDDVLEFVNSMFCEIIGFSPQKVHNSSFSSYLSPEYRRMVTKQFSKIMEKQKSSSNKFEVDLLDRKGETVPVEISPSRIYDQGKPAVMAIIRDITEQKKKEQELLDSLEVQKVLQTVIKSSPAIVFFWNAKSGWPVEFVSENIDTFGYSPSDFLSGKLQYGDIIHPSDAERVHSYFARKFAENASEYRLEYRIITRSDDVRWVVERSTPQYDEEGDLVHIQGIIMDITERKRINQFLNIESEVGNFFTPSGDLQETFDQLLEFALHIDSIDSGSLYLIDKDNGGLNLISHKGLSQDFVKSNSHYAADSMQSRFFMMGYPLYKMYSDIYPVTKRDNRVDEGLLATAVIPVKYQEEEVAVLFLASRTEYEMPYNIRTSVETVAEQMGSIIGRIESEVDMQKNQNDLKSLVDGIEDLILVLDSEGCVLYSNEAVSKKLAHSKEEITGMNFIKMHPHNKVLEAAKLFGDALAGNKVEFRLPLVTGTGMLMSVETRLQKGKWNRQDAIIAICREVGIN
ncbi:MAG: PAS domain S-box protein [Methanococcoides sp.]|nr:PAS domain S-box protein [Methanococcoides sp.]